MRPVSQIQEFRVKGFKSFCKARLRLSPLTMLVGPNASGKSNLIESMRLLRWLARGGRLDDIGRAMSSGELDVRGRPADLTWMGLPILKLGCSLPSQTVHGWPTFEAELAKAGESPYLLRETINNAHGGVPLYDVCSREGAEHDLNELLDLSPRRSGHDIHVAYNNFARGGKKPQVTCTDQQLVLTQLGSPSSFGEAHKESQRVIPEVTNAFRDSLGSMFFLDPVPRFMRGYANLADKSLLEDGKNLSSVLHHLCRPEGGQKEALLEFVRALPEQDIADISFVETPRGEAMVQLEESFASKREKRDAPILSDGTLRVLAAAAALLSARKGSLIVIEEIDNGVHPSRARLLLENILAIAKQRSLSVLLTAHNPALLDAVPMEAIPKVACCYRDPKTGDSCITHIEDLDSSPELLARGPLGSLATSGALERYLKDGRTPDEKAKAALAWVDKFQGAER
jgi:predicted ATPase